MNNIDCTTSEEALDSVPVGVLIVENGAVKWVNKTLADILQVSKDQLIGLRTDESTQSGFAPLFDASEKLCLTETDGNTRWFNREYVTLQGTNQIGQFFKEISELVALKKECDELRDQVQSLETKDPITGLLKQKAILQSLDVHLSRSRRYENPLSVLRLSVESSDMNHTNELLRDIGQSLKDQLRWADQIGMLDESTFLIVLPETGLDDAKELTGNLANNRAAILAAGTPDFSIKFGVAAWQKGDDARKLLQRLQRDHELSQIALLS